MAWVQIQLRMGEGGRVAGDHHGLGGEKGFQRSRGCNSLRTRGLCSEAEFSPGSQEVCPERGPWLGTRRQEGTGVQGSFLCALCFPALQESHGAQEVVPVPWSFFTFHTERQGPWW